MTAGGDQTGPSGFYATDDTCTHEYYSLAEGYIEGDVVECPLQMATFSICTGKALSAPATGDLAAYAVKVEDGVVYVDLGRLPVVRAARSSNSVA